MPVVRKPKRLRNLAIAAGTGAALAVAGWFAAPPYGYVPGLAVFALALVFPWFGRKLALLVLGLWRLLGNGLIRLFTALVFFGLLTPLVTLGRLGRGPWRAKAAADGKVSYAAPPRRPPTAADFERLR
jgi:hypothetical protein